MSIVLVLMSGVIVSLFGLSLMQVTVYRMKSERAIQARESANKSADGITALLQDHKTCHKNFTDTTNGPGFLSKSNTGTGSFTAITDESGSVVHYRASATDPSFESSLVERMSYTYDSTKQIANITVSFATSKNASSKRTIKREIPVRMIFCTADDLTAGNVHQDCTGKSVGDLKNCTAFFGDADSVTGLDGPLKTVCDKIGGQYDATAGRCLLAEHQDDIIKGDTTAVAVHGGTPLCLALGSSWDSVNKKCLPIHQNFRCPANEVLRGWDKDGNPNCGSIAVKNVAEDIKSGQYHSCTLTSTNKLKCWGRNNYGQLGLGDTEDQGDGPVEMRGDLHYVDVGTDRTVKAISLGLSHTCAILDNNKVKCWGNGGSGRLGLGNTSSKGDGSNEMGDNLSFVDLGTNRTAKAISLGNSHTCAILDNNKVKCWGYGANGRLGYGNTSTKGDHSNEMGDNLAFVDLGTNRTAKSISLGHYHTCAILDNDKVKCWGYNYYGQLGLGNTYSKGNGSNEMGDNLAFVDLGTNRTAKSISLGGYHTCAILDNDKVKCWGNGGSGRLGLGNTYSKGDGSNEMGDNLPYVDLGTNRTAKAISLRSSHTCAILDNDKLKCWGYNGYGQLGLGNTSSRGSSSSHMGDNLPYVDLGTNRTAKSISLGDYHTCAILDNDKVKCWGRNNYGQLGLGNTSTKGNGTGEMGDSLPYTELIPPPPDTITTPLNPGGSSPMLNASTLQAGESFAFFTASNCSGTAMASGTASRESSFLTPTLPSTGNYIFYLQANGICYRSVKLNYTYTEIPQSISLGSQHSCIVSSGKVKCWGYGGSGRLGLGNTSSKGDGSNEMGDNLSFVDLGTNRTAKAISLGQYHTCAILDNNKVKCWGYGANGRLGYGNTSSKGDGSNEMGDDLAFVDLGTGWGAKAISLGNYHTCAILNNDYVKCWGYNGYGQLGLGNIYSKGDGSNEMGDNLAFVDLGTGRTAKAISLGLSHTCAILDNNKVKCWGRSNYGQLGLGNTSSKGDNSSEMGDNLAFVDLGTNRTAKAVSLGSSHTCAILDNNKVKCWGYGANGRLGYGNTSTKGDHSNEMGDNLPYVDLGTNRTAKSISLGDYHTCAILDNDKVKCWGYNGYGQLGLGNTSRKGDGSNEMGDNLPYVDLGTNRTAKSISLGQYHTCAILDNDKVKCWGYNYYGQLGLENTRNQGDGFGEMGDYLSPVELAMTEPYLKLATPEDNPSDDMTPDFKAKGLSSGDSVSLHTTKDCSDSAKASGTFSGTELALTSSSLSQSALYEFFIKSGTSCEPPEGFSYLHLLAGSISLGLYHSCAIITGPKDFIKCWGYNGYGQLGLGNTYSKGDESNEMGDNLAFVDLGTGRTAKAISLGDYHTCAILDNNKVKCWGYNGYGQLGLGNTSRKGDGSNEMGDNLPYVDLGTNRTAKSISLGRSHTCAILDNNKVKCWGYGANGRLGYGNTSTKGDHSNEMGDNLAFVDLGTNRTAKAISLGEYHTCAILDNDKVKCWGSGGNGRLGLGNTSSKGDNSSEMGDNLAFVDLGTNRTAKSISLGQYHTCAILDNDKVKCWGRSNYGQLGLGNTSSKGDNSSEMGDNLAFVDLGTNRTAKAVSLGNSHTCAILDNDKVKCWGHSNYGQLGLGNTSSKGDGSNEMGDNLSFVDLGTNRTAKAVSLGLYHTCAILDNNKVKCWGGGGNGKLGYGNTSSKGDGSNEMGDNLSFVDLF